ncbi:MAG TPA: hypothetical protein VHD33_08435, partial [Legionellaceae bacterium]|nr:hypothetical protein [Legionellaceae bacterium]
MTNVVAAAAWMTPKDELLNINSAQMYSACSFWNPQGELEKGPCFNQFLWSSYFEYGFFDTFTGILNPNFNYFYQHKQYYAVPFGFENLYFA